MNLNKMKYEEIKEWKIKLLSFDDANKYIVDLFNLLNKVKRNSSISYKELLNARIKQLKNKEV